MERAPVMYHSLQAGHPVQMPEEETLADSLLGGIGLHNQYTFSLVQQLVDDVILLTEDEIARGMAFLLQEEHVVAEGAGATGVAALLADKASHLGQNIAVVVSGGNVAIESLLKVVQNNAGEHS